MLISTQPKVFVSYSHDSVEHQDRALEFADRLRADGIDAVIDQYEMLPMEGWPAWCANELRKANFVFMICTETHFRRVNNTEEIGRGHGVLWEARLIKQELYDSGSASKKFVPILLEGGSQDHIPGPIKGASFFRANTAEGYEALYRLLTNQPTVQKPMLGRLRELPIRQKRSSVEPPATHVANDPPKQQSSGDSESISKVPIDLVRYFRDRGQTSDVNRERRASVHDGERTAGHEWAALYEIAIRRLPEYIRVREDGTIILGVESGDILGVEPVHFADLKRSIDETNRKIRRGKIRAGSALFDNTRTNRTGKVQITWYGAVVEFDQPEIDRIISAINSGAASVATLSALLGSMGISAPASAVAAIISGLLWLGSAILAGSNSNQAGVQLTVLWVGAAWCKAR